MPETGENLRRVEVGVTMCTLAAAVRSLERANMG